MLGEKLRDELREALKDRARKEHEGWITSWDGDKKFSIKEHVFSADYEWTHKGFTFIVDDKTLHTVQFVAKKVLDARA